MPTESKSDDPFRVIILSGVGPRILRHLIDRIHRDVPESRVCGVLYHTPRPLSSRERISRLLHNLRSPQYARHAATRVADLALNALRGVGRTGLRFLHGYFPSGDNQGNPWSEFAESCRLAQCPILVVDDPHSEEALKFVRDLRPDLAIVYGMPILKPKLFELPRLGSINIHQRKVPEFRGGGPVGLWEMLDEQAEFGVTIHRVVKKLDAGGVIRSAIVPIEPFDTLESLALKAHVVSVDLVAQAVGDFARGQACETVQSGPSRMFRSPSPAEMARYRKRLWLGRPRYIPRRGWTRLNLLAKSLMFTPRAVLRNWHRRYTGTFPVIVLYHHLLADRPHFMGMSTDYFVKQMQFLSRYYRVVDLETGRKLLASGRVTAPTVVLTFDDGYKENYLRLRAAALACDVPATLLVCSQRIDSQQPFDHDTQRGIHGFPALSWDETRELEHWGYRIESHTRTHLDCGSTDPDLLRDEIVGSKVELEKHLGHAIDTFSFPFGQRANISRPAVDLAKSTYSCVMSAYGGINKPGDASSSWHLFRQSHAYDIWELELSLQSILDTKEADVPPDVGGGDRPEC